MAAYAVIRRPGGGHPSEQPGYGQYPKGALEDVTVKEGANAVWDDREFIPGVPGIDAGRETEHRIHFEIGSGHYVFVLNGRRP